MQNFSLDKRRILSADCKILSTKDDPKIQRLKIHEEFYKSNNYRINNFKKIFQERFVNIPINTNALKSKDEPFKMPPFLDLKATEFKLEKLGMSKDLFREEKIMKRFRKSFAIVERARKECNEEEEGSQISKRSKNRERSLVKKMDKGDIEEEMERDFAAASHDARGFLSAKFSSLNEEFEIKGFDAKDTLPAVRDKKQLKKGTSRKTVTRPNMSTSFKSQNSISSLADLESFLGFKKIEETQAIEEISDEDYDMELI